MQQQRDGGFGPVRPARRSSQALDRENGDDDAKREARGDSAGRLGERRRSRSRERSSKGRRSRSRSREKSKSKKRSRSRDRERRRGSRSRSRERRAAEGASSSGRRRSRSRSRERRRRSRSRDRDSRRRRSRSRDRGGGGGGRRGYSPRRGGSPGGRGLGRGLGMRSRSRSPEMPLTPEERDARTVFIMQLSQRCRARDVEEFFSAVGKIRDVKLIVCNKTRRFKGIAYVEFRDLESVPLALGLNGQKILGVPVIVQPSQAEKNRMGNYQPEPPRQRDKGPMRLYVGSLHFNITEEMLKGIFEPFGNIQSIQLMMDTETGRSKGYGFITYTEAEDAKKALEQLNGFELAGRPMKVGHVTERADAPVGPNIENELVDRSGVDLGATGRLALMAKLAEGTGMKLPQAANQALTTAANNATAAKVQRQAAANVAAHSDPGMGAGGAAVGAVPAHHQAALPPMAQVQQQQQLAETNPPIATQCFMLSNMFDPSQETQPGWDADVRDDVIDECNKYGGVLHLLVDTVSPTGNVYVKSPNIAAAVAAVNALHGRWFAGKVITAAYVPLVNYHNLFPDSIQAVTPLQTNR